MLSVAAQPLSPAVSHGNKSYNTNSPTTSLVIIVRNYFHTCACATYSSHSYYSRAAFISFRAPDCVATIWGGNYSRVVSIQRYTVYAKSSSKG